MKKKLEDKSCIVCHTLFTPQREDNIICKNKECKRLHALERKKEYRMKKRLENRSRYRSSEGAVKISGKILYREEYVRTCPKCNGKHYSLEEGECPSCKNIVPVERTVWNHNTARKL